METSSATSPTDTMPKMVVEMSELSKDEMEMVTTVHFTPATSVTEWLLRKDSAFRTTVAQILSATEFPIDAGHAVVSADDIIYVTPSPKLIPGGIAVYFLVRDSSSAFRNFHVSSSSPQETQEALSLTIKNEAGRRRRHLAATAETNWRVNAYIPSELVVLAVQSRQQLLESAVAQNVTLVSNEWTTSLGEMEPSAATSLFERRLDVFVPLILIAAICFLGATVAIACVQVKNRSSARWDPPAGVIYKKRTAKVDGSVCPAKIESGVHLASDDQCRDGEALKQAMADEDDDDDWVVPYERASNKSHLKTQFEDTKL